MNSTEYMERLGVAARNAARRVAAAEVSERNAALRAIAAEVEAGRNVLTAANSEDMANGEKNGLDAALLDRLALTPARIDGLLESLEQIATLPDPVGAIDNMRTMNSGIRVGRMRVPLGVVGIIYESRPNVTIEAASLCLKAGNAAILRGGKEAIASNRVLGDMIAAGLARAGLPESVVQVVRDTDRALVTAMVTLPEYIDIVIPRGGKGLIERVMADARVPVLKHLHGVCHVYVDGAADPAHALAIAVNAKTQRYGTCNTMETLLIDTEAGHLLPPIADQLVASGVELRGCERSRQLAPSIAITATEADWHEEYLAPILAVRMVDGLDAAIEHIAQYGSGHTESIVTENYDRAMRFLREVDASSVMVNASTRFADGFEYGLGAEIGISTDKLHARGPVGLEGLTSQKYIVFGNGHIRQ